MRNLSLHIFMLIFAALLPQVALADKQCIKVGDFNQLAVFDNINVTYRCNPDSAGLATINTSNPDIIDQILIQNNKKGKLSIQVATQLTTSQQTIPTLYVYSDSLREASNAGDSILRIESLAKTDQLKVTLSDNGKIIVHGINSKHASLKINTGRGQIIADGNCDSLFLGNLGTGELQADNISTKKINCKIIGTGTIGCSISNGELFVKGAGSGKVYYKGKPSNIKVRKIGPVKVIPMQ